MSPNYYIHVTRSFAMVMCLKRLPSCVSYLEIVLRWLYIIRSAQPNQGILMLTYLGLWIDWTTYVTRLYYITMFVVIYMVTFLTTVELK